MTDRPYPRRTLAAVTGLTLIAAGLVPGVMPGILVPPAVWEVAYVAGGLTLLGCAVWPATPLNVRAVGAALIAVALGASTLEVALDTIAGVHTFPRVLLAVAVLGALAAHTLALLTYWHRLDRLR